jgi:predicted acetyltransferase/diadenosine tetraphosphate (Ap4A) HIT family hydrolase
MPRLERPSAHVHTSFLAGMAQFQAEGRGAADDNSMVGGEIRGYADGWHAPEGFERYTRELCAQADPGTVLRPGHVPSTTYWWVEGDEYLGRIAVRHRLTPGLLEGGGHIGYDVPPGARRRGHATAMLRAVLPLCADLGLDRVLVVCDTGNVGSRKAIEACGGVYEDERHGKLRYWIATGGGAPGTAQAQVARALRAAISPYHEALPIGRRFEAATDFREWDVFPYESEAPLAVRILQEPVLPEPPRMGEQGPEQCRPCQTPDERYLWTDEHWRLGSGRVPSGAPAVVLLEPRGHHDLADLPAARAAELGPLLQRVERALTGLGGIARVHVSRWGDGAAHLHWWFLARPAGMTQFRGTVFALWDDLLPPIDAELWRGNLNRVAAAMAEDGGVARPLPEPGADGA